MQYFNCIYIKKERKVPSAFLFCAQRNFKDFFIVYFYRWSYKNIYTTVQIHSIEQQKGVCMCTYTLTLNYRFMVDPKPLIYVNKP